MRWNAAIERTTALLFVHAITANLYSNRMQIFFLKCWNFKTYIKTFDSKEKIQKENGEQDAILSLGSHSQADSQSESWADSHSDFWKNSKTHSQKDPQKYSQKNEFARTIPFEAVGRFKRLVWLATCRGSYTEQFRLAHK